MLDGYDYSCFIIPFIYTVDVNFSVFRIQTDYQMASPSLHYGGRKYARYEYDAFTSLRYKTITIDFVFHVKSQVFLMSWLSYGGDCSLEITGRNCCPFRFDFK